MDSNQVAKQQKQTNGEIDNQTMNSINNSNINIHINKNTRHQPSNRCSLLHRVIMGRASFATAITVHVNQHAVQDVHCLPERLHDLVVGCPSSAGRPLIRRSSTAATTFSSSFPTRRRATRRCEVDEQTISFVFEGLSKSLLGTKVNSDNDQCLCWIAAAVAAAAAAVVAATVVTATAAAADAIP
jgi:hypothetical protein